MLYQQPQNLLILLDLDLLFMTCFMFWIVFFIKKWVSLRISFTMYKFRDISSELFKPCFYIYTLTKICEIYQASCLNLALHIHTKICEIR